MDVSEIYNSSILSKFRFLGNTVNFPGNKPFRYKFKYSFVNFFSTFVTTLCDFFK